MSFMLLPKANSSQQEISTIEMVTIKVTNIILLLATS